MKGLNYFILYYIYYFIRLITLLVSAESSAIKITIVRTPQWDLPCCESNTKAFLLRLKRDICSVRISDYLSFI